MMLPLTAAHETPPHHTQAYALRDPSLSLFKNSGSAKPSTTTRAFDPTQHAPAQPPCPPPVVIFLCRSRVAACEAAPLGGPGGGGCGALRRLRRTSPPGSTLTTLAVERTRARPRPDADAAYVRRSTSPP